MAVDLKLNTLQLRVTPSEIASVVECLNAGPPLSISIFAPTTGMSLADEDLDRTLQVVRTAAPAAQVGVSTGVWIASGSIYESEGGIIVDYIA